RPSEPGPRPPLVRRDGWPRHADRARRGAVLVSLHLPPRARSSVAPLALVDRYQRAGLGRGDGGWLVRNRVRTPAVDRLRDPAYLGEIGRASCKERGESG